MEDATTGKGKGRRKRFAFFYEAITERLRGRCHLETQRDDRILMRRSNTGDGPTCVLITSDRTPDAQVSLLRPDRRVESDKEEFFI